MREMVHNLVKAGMEISQSYRKAGFSISHCAQTRQSQVQTHSEYMGFKPLYDSPSFLHAAT